MPALSPPAGLPHAPISNLPPNAIEHSLPVPVGTDAGSASSIPGPILQPTGRKGEAGASVSDRLRKRPNPWPMVFIVVMVIVLIAVGTVSYLGQQSRAAKRRFEHQLVGNWELVPGQQQLDRWDFAFHDNGHLQMALGSELNEGRWKVTSVRGPTGYVLISWPDDAPETMRVRLDGGTMHVSLDSVGNFAFRAATQ